MTDTSPVAIASERLAEFIKTRAPVFVLTGAGCSTASGIPDYRDRDGNWKHRQPMRYQEFVGQPLARQRYWARSMVGWPRVAASRPNAAHIALTQLERIGMVRWLTTQNVDGLHQKAGHQSVTDLHGRLDRVCCLNCERRWPRAQFQEELVDLNRDFAAASHSAAAAPDGDAQLGEHYFGEFNVPACRFCGGMAKPDVVFFGESVPQQTVANVYAGLDRAGAMLVAGSSLMVFSGYRFARRAAERGTPIAAVNLGATRADALLQLKLEAPCETLLPEVATNLLSATA